VAYGGEKGDICRNVAPADALKPAFGAVELDHTKAAWYTPGDIVARHF